MILSVNNIKDIDRYYTGCYVKYPQVAGDKPFMVQRVRGNEISGTHFEDGEEKPYIFKLFEEGALDDKEAYPTAAFLLPKKSFFMHEGNAHLLYRIPARQYKRGICRENTAVLRLTGVGEFENIGQMSWAVLNSYINKQDFSGFDLTGNKSSYAVNSRMAVCAAGIIYVDKIRIGMLEHKAKKITLKNDLFAKDVLNAVGNTGIGIFIGTHSKNKEYK